jgi:hypothetical protein
MAQQPAVQPPNYSNVQEASAEQVAEAQRRQREAIERQASIDAEIRRRAEETSQRK